MTSTSSDHELKHIERELEELLAQLFPVDSQPLRRIVRDIDASLLADVQWQTHARGVAEQTCRVLSARFGAWRAIYRLLEALHMEYANPAVTDLHRRVCASAYAGPLVASVAVREHAVRNFITHHFPDYPALRAFDGRGIREPASQPQLDRERV